jgi:hypothetical protein
MTPAALRRFRGVDKSDPPSEEEVEIFERIPWDSIDSRPDRRWVAYLVAGVIVLASIGVSIGRQIGPTTREAGDSTLPQSVSIPPGTLAPSTTLAVATTTPTTVGEELWTEADLMALPEGTVEATAATLAEWYVTDFFTRDQVDRERSFVEWVGAWEVEWMSPALARITVLVRRLAAVGDDPYQRLDVEAWDVITRLDDTGWTVAGGPLVAEAPELAVDVDDDLLEDSRREARTIEPMEWTDPAGVIWSVQTWDD